MASRTAPTRASMYCFKCGYALDGLASRRCPECGNPFDPRYPQTYSDGNSRRAFTRLGLRLAIIFFVGWLFYAFVINPSGSTSRHICTHCAAVRERDEWWIPGTRATIFTWTTDAPSPTHDVLAAHAIRTDCTHQWTQCGGWPWGFRGCILHARWASDFRQAAQDDALVSFFKYLAETEPAEVVEEWIDYAFIEFPEDLPSDRDYTVPPEVKLLGLLVWADFPRHGGFSSVNEFKAWWGNEKDRLVKWRDKNLARLKAY